MSNRFFIIFLLANPFIKAMGPIDHAQQFFASNQQQLKHNPNLVLEGTFFDKEKQLIAATRQERRYKKVDILYMAIKSLENDTIRIYGFTRENNEDIKIISNISKIIEKNLKDAITTHETKLKNQKGFSPPTL